MVECTKRLNEGLMTMKGIDVKVAGVFLGLAAATAAQAGEARKITEMDLVDISGEVERQSIVAAGTPTVYNGHPTTILADDDKTMFCFWPLGHGGLGGFAAMSEDAGRTWTRIDDRMPEGMKLFHECPMAHKLTGPDGKCRYWVWAGYKSKVAQGGDDDRKPMPSVMSEDGGKT